MERDEMTQKILDNIRETTGKTVEDFVKLVKDSKLEKHGQIRSYFKDEVGMKYGYANTLAHIVRNEIEGVSSGDELVYSLFEKKPDMLPIYEELITRVRDFGGDVEISPKKNYVSLRAKKQFGLLKPSTKTRFDVGLILKGKEPTDRLEEGSKWNSMCTHRVQVTDKKQVDDELVAWLNEAYKAAK